MFNKKGQGSLEYLLIIGGGILVAVVIIGAIISLAGTGTGGTKANVANQTCHTYLTKASCEAAAASGIGATNAIADCTTTTGDGTGDTTADGFCCYDLRNAADSANNPEGTRCVANAGNTY